MVYQLISGERENASLAYCSELEQTRFKELLEKNEEKDIALKRTSSGIHRDDIDFLMEERIIRRFGSQGQQKSFLVAVKLAQFQLLKKYKEVNPLLLLDDIFDKLDSERSANLLEFISGGEFGQIFISDTQRERIKAVFENMNEVEILEAASSQPFSKGVPLKAGLKSSPLERI